MAKKQKNQDQGTLWDIDSREPWEKEWIGMPEFIQDDLDPVKSLKINFLTEKDYEDFCKLINRDLTMQTKSIWFPDVKKGMNANKVYTDERKEE